MFFISVLPNANKLSSSKMKGLKDQFLLLTLPLWSVWLCTADGPSVTTAAVFPGEHTHMVLSCPPLCKTCCLWQKRNVIISCCLTILSSVLCLFCTSQQHGKPGEWAIGEEEMWRPSLWSGICRSKGSGESSGTSEPTLAQRVSQQRAMEKTDDWLKPVERRGVRAFHFLKMWLLHHYLVVLLCFVFFPYFCWHVLCDPHWQRLTLVLALATLISAFGSSFQYGYNVAVINSPSVVICQSIINVQDVSGRGCKEQLAGDVVSNRAVLSVTCTWWSPMGSVFTCIIVKTHLTLNKVLHDTWMHNNAGAGATYMMICFQQHMKQFYNNTHLERYGTPMEDSYLTVLWSLSVSMYPLGGFFGSLIVAPLVNKLGR